jgi:nicotinamidase-related amidase
VTNVRLDPARSALILVDLMTRVVSLDTAPLRATEVVSNCVGLADVLRAHGWLVVFVRAEHPGVDEQPPGGELAPGCEPQPGDLEIVKTTWGAFHQTDLEAELQKRNIRNIVLGGIATNFGVESTGRSAAEHGYSVFFLSDAMAGLHEYAHQFSIDYLFPRLGVTCTSTELLAGLA